MRTISVFTLRTYLGASATEIAKIRALFPDYQDDFPEADAARALLKIRQGSRARDHITEQHQQAQAEERTRKLLGGRRRMTR